MKTITFAILYIFLLTYQGLVYTVFSISSIFRIFCVIVFFSVILVLIVLQVAGEVKSFQCNILGRGTE